jgi:putative phosphoesterase
MGNMDYYAGHRDGAIYEELIIPFPDSPKVTLKIGLTHGSQIERRGNHNELENIAKEKGYHILVSGHTHKEEIYLTERGTLLLNPGSVTGAWSFIASGNNCFIVIEIREKTYTITVTLFYLDKKTRKMESKEKYYVFNKNKLELKY